MRHATFIVVPNTFLESHLVPPGPDVVEDKMYVITEVADYSLKDYLAARKEQGREMSTLTIQQISKSFVVAMAMLHVKGLVHLDMKPENIMRAGETWKVGEEYQGRRGR